MRAYRCNREHPRRKGAAGSVPLLPRLGCADPSTFSVVVAADCFRRHHRPRRFPRRPCVAVVAADVWRAAPASCCYSWCWCCCCWCHLSPAAHPRRDRATDTPSIFWPSNSAAFWWFFVDFRVKRKRRKQKKKKIGRKYQKFSSLIVFCEFCTSSSPLVVVTASFPLPSLVYIEFTCTRFSTLTTLFIFVYYHLFYYYLCYYYYSYYLIIITIFV